MAELAAWEAAVRERPSEARIFGPPSWLVLETWNEKKESFQDAAVRVRKQYGLVEPQGPRNESVTKRAKTVTKPRNVTEETVTKPQSAAERQKAYRGRQRG